MRNQKARELFSTSYLYIHFSNRTSEKNWWLNDEGEDWWSGVHTFTCDILYFVTDGEFDLTVDHVLYHIRPGQMIYIPAETEHKRQITGNAPLRKYYCSFDLMFGKSSLESFFKLPRIIDVADTATADALFKSLYNYQQQKEHAFSTIGTNGALLMLLSLFLEQSNATFLPSDNRIERTMLTIAKFINANLHRTITVAELSQLAGYSHDHFTKIFKGYFGCLPLKYISDVKLEHTKKRLTETHLPLSSIAEELGFCDASYFGKFFKKHTGLTPAQFRKTVKHRI